MRKFWIAALATLFALQGCQVDEPGQQCLDSFKADLKDPESGKVISFENKKLVYTAKNSYGARIQASALCEKKGDKWHRDNHTELMQILQKSSETLTASTACLKAGKSLDECAGESLALKNKGPRGEVDLDSLHKESKDALGF